MFGFPFFSPAFPTVRRIVVVSQLHEDGASVDFVLIHAVDYPLCFAFVDLEIGDLLAQVNAESSIVT